MTDLCITIADDLVVTLNDPARTWQAVPVGDAEDKRFTAVREWNPKYSLEELETFRVTVVPGEVAFERASRTLDKLGYEMQIGFQKKLQGTDAEIKDQVDGLVERVGEVMDYLRKNFKLILSPSLNAVLVAITGVPYSPEHLDESQVFTSFFSLTYQVFS